MARALAISGRDEAPTVQDLPVGEPGPGQVRLRVAAASVNRFDVAVASGLVWDAMAHEFPVVLGRDFAGTVDAVGEGVTSVTVGDAVSVVNTSTDLHVGGFAEQVVVDADWAVPVPDGVTPVQAAAAGLVGVSARDLVDALALNRADTVLVAGATGGVGALAVQLAAATGATVLATARPGSADAVRGFGATMVVDPGADLAESVARAAPGGLTAIAHAGGDPAAYVAFLAPGGRFVSMIYATNETLGRDDVTVTSVRATATPEKVRTLLEAVAAGELQVPVHATYALDDSPEALAAFGRPKVGKLVVIL